MRTGLLPLMCLIQFHVCRFHFIEITKISSDLNNVRRRRVLYLDAFMVEFVYI
jgi:hypothetical protein